MQLLAFGFLTWGFFWAGLGLVSIPIIIHLLNRRRFKTVTWAAMEFLLRAMRKNRRRLKFEQWLLLATRCLLIFLLGLALARPMGCESGALAQFGRHTALNVFIIDNSYSTAYAADHGQAKTHLEQARRLVRGLLSRAQSGGESVVLILASKPADAVIAEPQLDLESAGQTVDHIEQSWSSTDLRHALELALDVARKNDKQPNKNLYLITDATRSAWEGADAATFKQLGPQLAAEFKITHFNLSDAKPQWNGAVVDLRSGDNLISSKFSADFTADVRGYFPGVEPGHEASLQWTLDDQPIGKSPPSFILNGATKPQTLSDVKFDSGGPHVLACMLNDSGDRLSVDNVRHRVVDVASELRVLIVEGKRGIDPEQSSAHFLMPALAGSRQSGTGKPASSDSSFAPDVITDLELGNKVLGDYAAVILAGVGQISPSEADGLSQYARQGGTLLLFMGDAVQKDNYNAMLYKRDRLLPGQLVKVMSVGVNEHEFNFDFKPNSVLHPLLKDFANVENTGLDRVPVRSYWQVDIPPESSAERVLNYVPANPKAPADPAITTQTVGQGRVLFISTSANRDWTDFPNKYAFLEVLQGLLAGSVHTGDWWMNRVVGDHLVIPSSVRMTAAPLLTDSNGGTIVISPPEPDVAAPGAATAGEATAGAGAPDTGAADAGNKDVKSTDVYWRHLYHSETLTKPGIYTLTLGERKTPIAVEPPALEEADVTTLDNETIRRDLGDIPLTELGSELPADAGAGRDANDFSWWTMIAVLALVGFECFIAMRFGHYRRQQMTPAGAATGAI